MSVLLLMVLGTFASSVGVIVSSQPTSAAGEQALITADAYSAVLKNIAGRTFSKCNNFKSEITTADAAAGKIFGGSSVLGTVDVGFVVEPKDGQVGCGDENDTPSFLKLLGAYGYSATNQEPFLLSLGYSKTATGYKRTSNNTADFFKYTSYDKLPASTLYAMAYTEFTSAACSAQQNSSGSVTLKLVYQSGGSSTASTADVKYSYGVTDRRSYPSGAAITCGDMVKRVNDNAAGYATYLTDFIASEKRKTLIDGPIGDYCSAKYPSGVSSVVVQSCLNDTYAAYQACWAKVVDGGQAPIGSENAARDPSTAEKAACMLTKLGGNKSAIDALVAAIDSTSIDTIDPVSAQTGTDEASCTASGQTWDETTGTCVDNGAACTGGSLGWVLCPVATMIQGLIQAIAGMIGNILEINPIGGSTDLLTVWRIFVGFANLLLVIGFLIVIFSQATSVGLSAYGIKKMLPRIIAAAILINLSYFICTIAIDISNIVGASVRGIVNSVPIDVETSTSTFSTGATWASNVTAIALIGVTGWLAVVGYAAFVIPMLITGALAVVSIFLMIAIRQALVLLLVIAAPLAFAAMILPNTEQLFTKWRKLFINMLIMYPVIMFLLYGSKLVGQILQVANDSQGDDTSAMMTQMVVFVILTIAPFAGMYMYLKNSNKLMSMATGAVSKLGSGAQNLGNSWAKQKQKDVSDRQVARIQSGKGNLAKLGRKFDPRIGQIRRDAMSSQYDEAAKLAGARMANDYVKGRYGENSIQGARANAALSELDMKEAQMQLEYIHHNDGSAAFKAGLSSGNQALMNVGASRMVSTAKLGELQTLMNSDPGMGAGAAKDQRVASIVRHIGDKNFTDIKTQDLGMMYALEDMQNEATAATALGDLVTGTNAMGKAAGKTYYEKAAGASKAAKAGQEVFSLQKTIPHMQPYEAAAITTDKNILSTIKQEQLGELKKLAAGASNLSFQVPVIGGGTTAAVPNDIIKQVTASPSKWGAFSDKDVLKALKMATDALASGPPTVDASVLRSIADAEAKKRNLVT